MLSPCRKPALTWLKPNTGFAFNYNKRSVNTASNRNKNKRLHDLCTLHCSLRLVQVSGCVITAVCVDDFSVVCDEYVTL